jgi:hypothetical protein
MPRTIAKLRPEAEHLNREELEEIIVLCLVPLKLVSTRNTSDAQSSYIGLPFFIGLWN